MTKPSPSSSPGRPGRAKLCSHGLLDLLLRDAQTDADHLHRRGKLLDCWGEFDQLLVVLVEAAVDVGRPVIERGLDFTQVVPEVFLVEVVTADVFASDLTAFAMFHILRVKRILAVEPAHGVDGTESPRPVPAGGASHRFVVVLKMSLIPH